MVPYQTILIRPSKTTYIATKRKYLSAFCVISAGKSPAEKNILKIVAPIKICAKIKKKIAQRIPSVSRCVQLFKVCTIVFKFSSYC